MPALLVVLSAVLLLVSACGDDTERSDQGAQPSPDVSTFEEGEFGDIPLHPTSEPLSPRHEEEGTVSRSYLVRNTTPEEVLRYYENELSQYEVVESSARLGVDTFRGRWLVEGRTLTVSATPAGNLEDDAEGSLESSDVLTQYSLSLAAGSPVADRPEN